MGVGVYGVRTRDSLFHHLGMSLVLAPLTDGYGVVLVDKDEREFEGYEQEFKEYKGVLVLDSSGNVVYMGPDWLGDVPWWAWSTVQVAELSDHIVLGERFNVREEVQGFVLMVKQIARVETEQVQLVAGATAWRGKRRIHPYVFSAVVPGDSVGSIRAWEWNKDTRRPETPIIWDCDGRLILRSACPGDIAEMTEHFARLEVINALPLGWVWETLEEEREGEGRERG